MSIKNIAMFKGLSNMELAKLLGNLEKKTINIGITLFEKGDFGDNMYIIEEGKIDLYSTNPNGNKQLLATLSEGSTFGEMALLTGEVRSATAVARLETSLFIINKEVFDRLITEHSLISAYFIRMLSQRLVTTNTSLQESKQSESQWILHQMNQMPKSINHFLFWCSAFPLVSKELTMNILNISLDETFTQFPDLKLFLHINPMNQESFSIRSEIRSKLRELCVAKYGYHELDFWFKKALEFYELKEHWTIIMALHIDNEDWESALQLIALVINKVSDIQKKEIFDTLWGCPKELLANHHDIFEYYMCHCMKHAPEVGLQIIDTLVQKQTSSISSRQMVFMYEWGAELAQILNKKQQALTYLKSAKLIALSDFRDKDFEANNGQNYGLMKQKLASSKNIALAKNAARLLKRNSIMEIMAVLFAVLCVMFFYSIETKAGLSTKGMHFIGISIAAVVFWIIDVIPNYIVALGMVMLWVLGGIVPPEFALSGFATTTWLFMIFIMAFSAVMTKSGILYRFSLYALKRFPSNYRGQLWGIIAAGIIMNPLIPSSNAKVSLGVPISRILSEAMGIAEKSNGAAGLGLAAMIFYGFTSPFVLTGSYINIMAYGLVPTEQPITWIQWFLYALPGFLIFCVAMAVILAKMFKHISSDHKMVSKEVLNEQIKLLGPLSKVEYISIYTIASCIILIILQPLHGIDNTWIMLMGFSFLVISGVLERQTITTDIDWTFLLFLGIAFSFTSVAKELGISDVMSILLRGHMSWFLSSPFIFLTAVVVLSFLVTLIIRDVLAVILLVTAFLPLGTDVGIHPWVLVFVILLATDPFFFSYQSPTYLTAYYSSEGKAFTHQQGQRVAFGYAFSIMLLVLFSIPYWKFIGLIH